MDDAGRVTERIGALRRRHEHRDKVNAQVEAIRDGDYDKVAPGLFPEGFDKPLIANLVDVSARDIAESMASMPSINCQAAVGAPDAEQKRSEKRGAVAQYYVQHSRLEDQLTGGADRHNSYGFMAYIVEPDFEARCPFVRIGDTRTAYYSLDYRGRTREYAEVYRFNVMELCNRFPDQAPLIKAKWYGQPDPDLEVEVAKWYDADCQMLVCLDPEVVLLSVENPTKRCPVRIVPRSSITSKGPRSQFDDVIWVQVARALVQMYTMNALERSVNAPLITPKDVNEVELGPFATIQTDNPQGVGYVPLQLAPGLFPQQQVLQQEQRVGSRYPEGRSGSMDASIITGQGVQALMGTFDTQVASFQRLNATALEDVIEMCFEMDEAIWPGVQKTVRIKDNGAPRKVTYTPAKDIAGEYAADVSYGAIAGLDPNRGLVFILQALAGGLVSKGTARRTLPMDLNIEKEEQQLAIEAMSDSIVATLAAFPQALPQMVLNGMDPREIATQIADVKKRLGKGEALEKIVTEVFAPKEEEEAPQDPLEAALAAAQGSAGPGAMPGEPPQGSDMLMTLLGMTPGGNVNSQATVSRMQPI